MQRTKSSFVTAILLMLVAFFTVGCDSAPDYGPAPVVRTHNFTVAVQSCPSGQYSVSVEWVNYDWQAVFIRNGSTALVVRDANQSKSSGCLYSSGDVGLVKLIPEGELTQYLDEAVTPPVTFK